MSNIIFKPGDWAYYVSPFYGRIAFGKIVYITETKHVGNVNLKRYAMDVPLVEEPEVVANAFETKSALIDFLMANVVNDAKS
jgi:hypothetical protein